MSSEVEQAWEGRREAIAFLRDLVRNESIPLSLRLRAAVAVVSLIPPALPPALEADPAAARAWAWVAPCGEHLLAMARDGTLWRRALAPDAWEAKQWEQVPALPAGGGA